MVVYLISCGNQSNRIGQYEIDQNIFKLKQTVEQGFDAIVFTSDLKVAMDSCNVFCENIVTKKEYIIDSNLREINFGKWEGLTWDDVYLLYPEDLSKFSKNWIVNSPTMGESFSDVIRRVKPFLDKIKEYRENVLVFSHPSAIRAILCCVLQIPLERAYSIRIDYGNVYSLEYNNDWEILMSNSPIFM